MNHTYNRKNLHNTIRQAFIVLVGILSLVFCLNVPDAFSEEASEFYEFERMWPVLPQPWYFLPSDIAVDKDGNVYIADYDSKIHKFDSDGNFITKWGSGGSGDGQFFPLWGIAVDSIGNVYVAGSYNNHIQKFDSDGNFITKWGSEGSGDGQFQYPKGIAVDDNGNIYVVDVGNSRIQKFDSDGNFITKWGSEGSGDGQFQYPEGIAVDGNGNVYVADSLNYRIQKFDSDGNFITKWGSYGSGDGQFREPWGIAVNDNGNIYVADETNDCIQKFDSDGNFITKWGSYGSGDGQFQGPEGIAVDGNGNVYVADFGNDRIQRFDSDGDFINKWGSQGSGDGQFDLAIVAGQAGGIAVDINGNVYVVDRYNDRIQKFDSDGNFMIKWGSYGSGDGFFNEPIRIAVDRNGNVYVSDTDNYRIQKFDSDGDFITKWGSYGSGDGQFRSPWGIAVDGNGNVYVADSGNNRIQKFDSNGNFITKWGSEGYGDGEFGGAQGIAVDSVGNVYVADSVNLRIQKFDSDGNFITKWGSDRSSEIVVDSDGNFYTVEEDWYQRIQKFDSDGQFIAKVGTWGSSLGQFNKPSDLAIGPNGNLYIADAGNNRIQVFKKVNKLSNSKAIVVAGGGPFSGNTLWDTTKMLANYAYTTLTYQGYTKDTIYYLSADTDLDLDGNGILDDVDADATSANLEEAITDWAADADDVVVYLVDHGGTGTFRMSGEEIFDVTELNSWLNTLQDAIVGVVIIVYDACESGSFMNSLTPPAGKNRIVITSTSLEEAAYFLSSGTISFSNYFWTEIFSGNSLYSSFTTSSDAMESFFADQTPLIDANGNGIGNEEEDMTLVQSIYIGNSTVYAGSAPEISSISATQTISNTTLADLYAESVTDDDGVSRVWAVIMPPDYLQGPSDQAVQSLPSINLKSVGNNRYEVTYDDFTIDGTYQVAIYAMDGLTNTSAPEYTTVSVNSPMGRKAIIVAGASQTDTIWTAVDNNARLAYESLTFQGYKDEDIYYMSDAGTTGVDVSLTLDNIDYAINTWAAANTQDLVIYMIGNGDNGLFRLNETDILQATDLDTWLDDLQSVIPGDVAVVYDGPLSGSIIPLLTPPLDKERIVVCSTADDEAAYFLSDGDISFSRFFWQQISNGDSVYDSYVHAKNSITGQTPQIDDNGNGLSNEKEDGIFSRDYYLGVGIMLGADSPMIGSVSPDQTVGTGTLATIWAEDVTTTREIDRVWAIITPQNYIPNGSSGAVLDMPTMDFVDVGDNRYEITSNDFTANGTYKVTIYAKDTEGNMSLPETTSITISDTTGTNPIPDIKANDTDGTLDISEGDQLSITISLDSGSYSDTSADWWLVVSTPSDEFKHYDLSQGGFASGLSTTYQGGLFDLESYAITIDTSSQTTGAYTYYFGVDLNQNGTLDIGHLYYDGIVVNVE